MIFICPSVGAETEGIGSNVSGAESRYHALSVFRASTTAKFKKKTVQFGSPCQIERLRPPLAGVGMK
jgi:hypothetical protein